MLGLFNKKDKHKDQPALNQLFELLSHKMAHNLRTPIVSIKIGISITKEKFPVLLNAYSYAIENGFKPEETLENANDILKCLDNCEQDLHGMNDYLNLIVDNLKNAITVTKAEKLLTIKKICE